MIADFLIVILILVFCPGKGQIDFYQMDQLVSLQQKHIYTGENQFVLKRKNSKISIHGINFSKKRQSGCCHHL